MTAYGVLICFQTLLAMAALGLAGGWVLWALRSPQRPYLWLAAPLAGIPALAGSLLALYFLGDLSLGPALALSLFCLSGITIACIRRTGVRRPTAKELIVSVTAIVGSSVWGTYTCNWTAMREGEPTLAIAAGSDPFCYGMTADWYRTHRASEVPEPSSRIFELLPSLFRHDGRNGAHLLNGAAALARHSSALFSYDWLCGVILSCAAAGLGGLFAAGPFSMLLLLATALSSVWLANSREGYLGKTLCYPACILLGTLCVQAWIRPSVGRVTVACLIGPGVAVCLHPIVTVVVMALVLGGAAAGLVVCRLCRLPAVEFPEPAPPTWRLLIRAILLYVAVTGPAFVTPRLPELIPAYPLNWDYILKSALDVDSPYIPVLGAAAGHTRVIASLATALVLLLLALRSGNVSAQGFLLSSALVPVAWILGETRLYGFHGLLYPLTAVGAVLLLNQARLVTRRQAALVASLALVLVLLRGRQFHVSLARCLARSGPTPIVLGSSEIEAIRERIGAYPVDLCTGNWPECFAVLSELACRGTDVRLRPAAWERTLAGPAAFLGCNRPAEMPRARFSIIETGAFAPAGSVRYCGNLLKLCEDGNTVAFVGFHPQKALMWDHRHSPILRLSESPAVVAIHNGTGTIVSVRFRADTPCDTYPGHLTLRHRLDKDEGTQALGPDVTIPLQLAPGLHHLVLTVDEVPPSATSPLLLNLRLETAFDSKQ